MVQGILAQWYDRAVRPTWQNESAKRDEHDNRPLLDDDDEEEVESEKSSSLMVSTPTWKQSGFYLGAIVMVVALVVLAINLSSNTSNSLARAYKINDETVIPLPIKALPDWTKNTFNEGKKTEPDGDKIANKHNLEAWRKCVATNTCAINQEKVVIMTDFDFADVVQGRKFTGGEGIWARSMHAGLVKAGFTLAYFPGVPLKKLNEVVQKEFSSWERVTFVVAKGYDIDDCSKDQACYYSSHDNAHGVPMWKTLSQHFWDGPFHPLGPYWTLNPEPYSWTGGKQRYIGYSIEQTCRSIKPIMPSHRFGSRTKAVVARLAAHAKWQRWSADKIEAEAARLTGNDANASRRSAFILAKRMSYFGSSSFGADVFRAAYKRVNIQFEMGASNDTAWPNYERENRTIPSFIFEDAFYNHHRIAPQHFLQLLSTSSIMIGIGNPALSPSPYDALCQGVPFLNPIEQWDHDNPSDRTKWTTQHDGLKHLDAPYVYNVFRDDREGFIDAIQSSLNYPIKPYVLPRMRQEEVDKRVLSVFSSDFRSEAMRVYDECIRSKNQKEGPQSNPLREKSIKCFEV